ncbi:MAG TPA: M20 family metallopeptidase [Acidimicrobiia bacterium]|nr:M20 family metallopeptidase [Acidimicrobiia bacterium]
MTLKERAAAAVDAVAPDLVALSHAIHERPELAYEERFAAGALADAIEAHGIDVERSAFGLDTAFVARAGGEGGPHVAICCEYDALPGIGHACGHNVIATAGLGAGLALARLAVEAGGRVSILGTPAEEGGGGKIQMAERGAFEGVDVAMMVHSAGSDLLAPEMLAMIQLDVRAHGKEAHAAGFPWRGRNALDAIVLGYVGVAALRQHIHPSERVHGIITHGGEASNVVPRVAAARFNVRSSTVDRLERLRARVLACFEGAAAAAGCELEHRFLGPYADLVTNAPLAAAYRANAEGLGRVFIDPDEVKVPAVGSTDMGNVSQIVPAIHPMIAVAPPNVPLHTEEFASYAVSEQADQGVVDGAKALAMTAIDVWTDPELLARIRSAFAGAGAIGGRA